MTNEEKLLNLLQIAVENGWKSNFIQKIQSPDFIIEKCTVYTAPLMSERYFGWEMLFPSKAYSLNDLVSNWEEGKVSFIEALCREDNSLSTYRRQDLQWKVVRNLWFTFENDDPRPDEERLIWLLNKFEHLL